MAIAGNDGVVRLGSTTIGEVRSYSIEATADTIETSVMGNDTRVYVKGMSTFSGTADVLFNSTEFTALQPAISGTTQVGTAPVTLQVWPTGNPGTGSWQGNIVITGYTVNASYDGLIEASISFQGSGAVSFS